MQVGSNSSDLLDLAELAEKHALNVPFRIRVVNGFMAADNLKDPTFSVDEIYSVHLVKETKVLKANWGGSDYFIPMNSTARFGLIQNEVYNSKLFGSVSELLDNLPPPIVAAALNDHTDHTGVLLLRQNDILVISSSGKKRSKSFVKAYNISMQKAVSIKMDANIKFTINPSSILLYLPDFIEHVNLPRSCLMSGLSTSISKLQSSYEVKLVEPQTQRSVLVSLFRSNPKSRQKKETNFIEVPTRINIIVRIMDDSSEDEKVYQQLVQESRELLQDYNPAKIQACMDSENDSTYMTQAQLLAEVRKEREKMTLTRLAPQNYEEIIIGDLNSDPKQPSSPPPYQNATVVPKKSSMPIPPSIPKKSPMPIPPLIPKKSPMPIPPSIPKKPPTSAAKQPLPQPPPFSRQSEPATYKELDPATRLGATQYEVTHISEKLSSSTKNKRNDKTATSASSNTPVESIARVPPKVHPRSGPVMYEDIDQIRPFSQNTQEQTHTSKRPKKESPAQVIHKSYKNGKPHSTLNSASEEKNVDKLKDMDSQIQELHKKMKDMEKLIGEMQSRQYSMENELKHLKSIQKEKKKVSLAIYRDSSPAQIVEVLEAAGLSQYIEAFVREMIDGEIFAGLDEDTLAEELGVTSKIHRMRLMKLLHEK